MDHPVAPGMPAPDFALPDHEGKTLTLRGFAGRPLVLYFYPKDDTSGCTAEAIDFSSLADAFAEAGAAVIGVSPDPVKSHAKFRTKHDLAIPLASDEEKTVLAAYGVWVEKSMYGRKYMGVERTTVLVGPRRARRQDLAQGEGAGTRRGGSGRREGARLGIGPESGFGFENSLRTFRSEASGALPHPSDAQGFDPSILQR